MVLLMRCFCSLGVHRLRGLAGRSQVAFIFFLVGGLVSEIINGGAAEFGEMAMVTGTTPVVPYPLPALLSTVTGLRVSDTHES